MRMGIKRKRLGRTMWTCCLLTAALTTVYPVLLQAQDIEKTEELARKARTTVAPVYPDVARRMGIAGSVRLAVVVAPNGAVKSSKVVGGHPVLENAAQDAMRQWKFEPAASESSGIVEFKFKPN